MVSWTIAFIVRFKRMKSFVRSVIMFQPLVKGYMIVAARKKVTFEREKQNKEKSSKSSHYQIQTGFFLDFSSLKLISAIMPKIMS